MTRLTTIVAISAGIYLFVSLCILGWVMYEVSTAGEALSQRVHAIADTNAKLKAYNDLTALMNSTEKERAQLASYVLTESKTSAFLTDIEELGRSQGVELSTDSLKVVEKEGSFKDLVIQFSIEGQETLVRHMIGVLETLPYHSQLSSLTFRRDEDGSIVSNIELTVTLSKI